MSLVTGWVYTLVCYRVISSDRLLSPVMSWGYLIVTTSSPFILHPSDLLFLQPVTPIALRSAEEQQETIPITPLQGAYTSSPHSVTLLNRSAPHSSYHPSQRLQMALPYPGHAHSGYILPPMPGAAPVLPPHPHMPSRPASNTSQFYPYPWP